MYRVMLLTALMFNTGCGYLFVMGKQGHTELTETGKAVEIVDGAATVKDCKLVKEVEVVEEYWEGTLCDGAKAVIPVRKKARNDAAAAGANAILVQTVNSAGCSATLIGKAYRCEALPGPTLPTPSTTP
jgi:hypothetical protein